MHPRLVPVAVVLPLRVLAVVAVEVAKVAASVATVLAAVAVDNAVVGRVREEYGCEPVSYDQMRKGSWDIHARIEDMNANGILASINFPSVVHFDGALFHGFQDKNLARIIDRKSVV